MSARFRLAALPALTRLPTLSMVGSLVMVQALFDELNEVEESLDTALCNLAPFNIPEAITMKP